MSRNFIQTPDRIYIEQWPIIEDTCTRKERLLRSLILLASVAFMGCLILAAMLRGM